MSDGGRVIAGSAAGLRLVAPGSVTRPLADRVKQTLFAILEPDLPGAVVLDLFAGSGAAGIEALSRGAARAVFVDRDAAAIRSVRANLARTGLADRADVRPGDALSFLRSPDATTAGPFGLVIVDPPYADTTLLVTALEALAAPGAHGAHGAPGARHPALLAPDARLVAKHFWRDTLPEAVGSLVRERERRFGETALTFFRAREARE